MKNFTTYLFVMLMAMFWLFRLVVCFCYSLGIDFITEPLDLNFEIVLLFVAFVSMILVIKRKMLGAVIYLLGYGLYFGTTILNVVMSIINGEGNLQNYTELLFAFMGVALPLLVLFDLLLDKNRKAHPVDKKTDWFYKNKAYDRQLDERADKNNYKLL